MKKLTLPDSFALARVIKKGNLKELFVNISAEVVDGQIDNDKAIAFLSDVFMNLSSKEAEEEVYNFLAGIFEMTVDEVKALGFGELGTKFKELAKENDLTHFLDGVRKLMK